MSPRFRPASTLRVCSVLLPLSILMMAAAVSARKPRDVSVLPGGAPAPTTPDPSGTASELPPSPAPPSATAKSDLEIRVLRAGPAPYAWSIAGRVAASFITDSACAVELVAVARLKGHPELDDQISWSVVPPAGFGVAPDAVLQGSALRVSLTRPAGNPTGMGGPLALSVTARVTAEGGPFEVSRTLQQDLRDRLRQEYVDLSRSAVPDRDDFIDGEQFARRFGKKYRDVSFAELNFSKVPGTDLRYPFIAATERLVETVHKIRKLYGPVTVSSGFRDPVRQLEVHGSVGESHHQYGRAADLYVVPDSAPPKTGRGFASEMDWLRLAAASLRAGGVWIEPMTDVNVNTDHCHVHVDVREEGSRSAVVRVAGRVTDAGGNPVPGATVRLAGMPAVTNSDGKYVLKHVLTPREYDLQVSAPGLEPLTQKVAVTPETSVALQFPPSDKPTLTARAAGAETDASGNLNVRLALRNVGRSAAMGVSLAAASAAASVGSLAPAGIRSLAPGKEQVVLIQLASRGGFQLGGAPGAPLKLTASFRTPTGEPRVQDLALEVPMPHPPAPAQPTSTPESSEVPKGGTPPREEPLKEPKRGPDLAPAAGGVLIGGAAAAAAAAGRRKATGGKAAPAAPQPAAEPSALPTERALETGPK